MAIKSIAVSKSLMELDSVTLELRFVAKTLSSECRLRIDSFLMVNQSNEEYRLQCIAYVYHPQNTSTGISLPS